MALVTGAGGPTGSVIARVLAEAGASIAFQVRRSSPGIGALVDEIAQIGTVVLVEGPIDRRESAQDLVRRAAEQLGPIDILVNNAGGMRGAPFTELGPDELEHTFDANLRTAWWCSQAVLPAMVAQGWGRIVNLSSIASTGSSGNANYAVSKAAVDGLTKTLALEYGRKGVTVNAVVPGLIANRKLDALEPTTLSRLVQPSVQGRAVEPVDVANAVLFLASEQARYITSQLLHVSAGLYHTTAGMETGS